MIEADITLLPGLTVGTLIALAGFAGTFAVMKSRTDDLPKWRESVSEELKEIREQQDEKFEKMRESQDRHHAENRAGIDKIRESVQKLSIAVGTIQESNDADRYHNRNRGRDRE